MAMLLASECDILMTQNGILLLFQRHTPQKHDSFLTCFKSHHFFCLDTYFRKHDSCTPTTSGQPLLTALSSFKKTECRRSEAPKEPEQGKGYAEAT